jgi:hypothetical protein
MMKETKKPKEPTTMFENSARTISLLEAYAQHGTPHTLQTKAVTYQFAIEDFSVELPLQFTCGGGGWASSLAVCLPLDWVLQEADSAEVLVKDTYFHPTKKRYPRLFINQDGEALVDVMHVIQIFNWGQPFSVLARCSVSYLALTFGLNNPNELGQSWDKMGDEWRFPDDGNLPDSINPYYSLRESANPFSSPRESANIRGVYDLPVPKARAAFVRELYKEKERIRRESQELLEVKIEKRRRGRPALAPIEGVILTRRKLERKYGVETVAGLMMRFRDIEHLAESLELFEECAAEKVTQLGEEISELTGNFSKMPTEKAQELLLKWGKLLGIDKS